MGWMWSSSRRVCLQIWGRSGWGVALALLVQVGPLAVQAQAAGPRFNDSGQTLCHDPVSGVALPDCAGSGQDGDNGRDLSNPAPKDGQAGFSWRKIAADGSALPNNAKQWACVQDQVTGLTWEVKTADNGLRDRSRTYTQIGDGSSAEASVFVAAVNAEGLCGQSDWRLPSRLELLNLVNYMPARRDDPAIDAKWFPNTQRGSFWTANSVNFGTTIPSHWTVNFITGSLATARSSSPSSHVRLVRGPSMAITKRYVAQDAEVLDRLTGLVWRRCLEGQAWDGSQCTGSPTFYDLSAALAQARAQAAGGVGWRLPNVKELISLVDESRTSPPALDTLLFPGVPNVNTNCCFWTSTTLTTQISGSLDTRRNWGVTFYDGRLFEPFKGDPMYLRLVRAGP